MKKCLYCNKNIVDRHRQIKSKYTGKTKVYLEKNNSKFCSQSCYHSYCIGKKLTGDRLIKARECARRMIDRRKNNLLVRNKWIEKMKEVTAGSKNHRWIEDRSKLVNQDERNNYYYVKWTINVKIRDNYKCKINNKDCSGRMEVHHILSWKDYPELRYKINNGITLCHAHHPRAKGEEKRLIPFLQELVSVSN